MAMPEHQGDPIVVEQSNMSVNVLWGFLSVVFAVALWRGHQGAQTGAGRLALDVIFGVGVIASVTAWISFHRRPARLEISQDVIRFSHRGRPNTIELRRPGPLYVHRVFNPRGGAQSYLKVAGSDDAIPLVLFNFKDVERACRSAGWPVEAPSLHRWWRRKRSPG
ncbi:MAG: hypothetical protein M3217_05435 [Actinomycetota bacterium]|nr:hypothetical protein [Actinomycetota bacterium]